MSKELIYLIKKYVCNVIIGFESGMYKTIIKTNPDRIDLMKSKHHPFITIFRDAHERYYTTTFNSIVKRDDNYVVETFDNFSKVCDHSKQCLLNILANLIVPIHFNLDRSKLNINTYEEYVKTLEKEIIETLSVIQLEKLFNHECSGPKDNGLKLIPDGEKFITIDMAYMSNGIKKPIDSFTEDKN